MFDIWMPGGLICSPGQTYGCPARIKNFGQSVEGDLFSSKKVWVKVNIIEASGNFRRVSQLCVRILILFLCGRLYF